MFFFWKLYWHCLWCGCCWCCICCWQCWRWQGLESAQNFQAFEPSRHNATTAWQFWGNLSPCGSGFGVYHWPIVAAFYNRPILFLYRPALGKAQPIIYSNRRLFFRCNLTLFKINSEKLKIKHWERLLRFKN